MNGERQRPYYISSYKFYEMVRELFDELNNLDPKATDEDLWVLIVGYFSRIEQKTANAIKS